MESCAALLGLSDLQLKHALIQHLTDFVTLRQHCLVLSTNHYPHGDHASEVTWSPLAAEVSWSGIKELNAKDIITDYAELEMSYVAELSMSYVAELSMSYVAELSMSYVAELSMSYVSEPSMSHVSELSMSHVSELSMSYVSEQSMSHVSEPSMSYVAELSMLYVAELSMSYVAELSMLYVGELSMSYVAELSMSHEFKHLEHKMEGEEWNRTMTALANSTVTPAHGCTGWGNIKWLLTYQPYYMWIVFILGFIENLFVISVFLLHKSRCTVTEIFLGNMAASDMIFVIGHPFLAMYISNNYYWQFGGFMCSALTSLLPLNIYSSIYFLMMVSIERYLALVKPMSIGRLKRPWWAKVICGIIWASSALLSVPDGVFTELKYIEKLNATKCAYRYSANLHSAKNITLNVLGFLVPLVVTTFCTSQMIRVLRRKAPQKVKKVNKERKATWLVLTVFLVFIVCWLPYNISTFIYSLVQLNVLLPCTVKSVNRIVYSISLYLVQSNSCINPLLYCMVGNNFRQKAREVYRRLLWKGADRWRPSLRTDESVKSTLNSFSIEPNKKESIV
ncbi:B2 bradykinin receptor-like [Dendropsophus ebraccatus]|uniref:B2 bradykinin receptor-like n=1 Tax=Dendropsophus ebraccatus TaxID=150705 RepID=UPI003831F786